MQRFLSTLITAGVLMGALVGCQDSPAINRVGVNVVDKSLFTGSWYYSRTTIDVAYEQAGWGSFQGDAVYDFGDQPGQFAVPRIRWVIDEDALYAYRDYEMYETGDTEAGEEIHHPVAAFGIESHFDIQRDYNALTGEQRNVIVENSTDRRWYEREYMRVDWSKNLLSTYQTGIGGLYEMLGLYTREPAELFVQGQSDFPDSWRVQFHFMQCQGRDDESCDENERELADDYEPGDLYHFSFVTQELVSPGMIPNPFTGRMVNFCMSPYSDAPQECTTARIMVRNSFLKVSDRQYEQFYYSDVHHERHGYFRIERPTFDRSTNATDPGFGATDFMNYGASRWNMWRQWNDSDGNPLPYTERDVRKLVFHTTTEMPAHLMKPSFEMMAQWSTVLMNTVRQLRGEEAPSYPEVACQDTDPQGYCYCLRDGDNVLNPTCNGVYNPFESPEQAAARGVTNPFQCHVAIPDGAEPDLNDPGLSDDDFYAWFEGEMVGEECAVELRVNDCNRATIEDNGGTRDGMNCQERGDMRYHFLSYVDQPGTRFLGIATVRSDPVTGETIACDANHGGPALDSYRTRAMQEYDLINGTLSQREFVIGEDIRSFIENLNNVSPIAQPRENFRVPSRDERLNDRTELINRMDQFIARAEQLQGAEGRSRVYTDRRRELIGTDIERRLMSNPDVLAMAGISHIPDGMSAADLTEDQLNAISPFRTNINDRIEAERDRELRFGMNNVLLPNEYSDQAVFEYVQRNASLPRARVEIELNRFLYYGTQIHEFGHCMGLRHQFRGSIDRDNYRDGYFYIDNAIPLPDPADFNVDGVAGLSAEEQIAFEDAYNDAQQRRERAGIDRFMGSAVMEYPGDWYSDPAHVVDRYDTAAVSYGYGQITEVYDNAAGLDRADITPVNTNRIWAFNYTGGETCSTDAECPHSAGGSRSGELLATNTAIGATQTCIPHPGGTAFGGICSSFDQDMARIEGDQNAPRYVNVAYQFCTDERVGTLSDCHRWDEGESFRQIVRNSVAQYENDYLFTHFRRYRRTFSLGGALGRVFRYYDRLQAIYGNLIYEYQNNPNYVNELGNFGFDDHFLASADALNFFARVLAQPGAGSYAYDRGWERYERSNDNFNDASAQLALPLGMARYANSEYQSGLTGIQRIELVGSFYEKWITLQTMTTRGVANGYARDVPYLVSLYDLFPVEMQQIYQGLILNQPEAYSPRVQCASGTFPNCEDPRLVYMDFYRGDCSDPATCRPSPQERYADLEVVDSGSNATLQFLGTVFALSDIPVFFDTSFQNQLFVCVEGSGECFEPSAGDVEGEDYVTFFSERYGKTFYAWQVEPGEGVPNQSSMGFEMVRQANELSFLVEALRTYRGDFTGGGADVANLSPEQTAELARIGYSIPVGDAEFVDDEIDRLYNFVRNRESFFFQLIQLQRQMGITGYLRF